MVPFLQFLATKWRVFANGAWCHPASDFDLMIVRSKDFTIEGPSDV